MGATNIAARLSALVFLGERLCHSQEWIEISIHFTVVMMRAQERLRTWPVFTRHVVHWFLPEMIYLRKLVRDSKKIIEPELAARRATRGDVKKPQDSLSWLDDVRGDRSFDVVCGQLFLNVAAIHTTSSVITATICMKESQRLNILGPNMMNRYAEDDVTLSDGTLIRRGCHITIPTLHMRDKEIFGSNADDFDGYRFLRMRELPGQENKWQFVSTSPEFLSFGHGKHACPGRFFASNEIKIALIHLLMNYDWDIVGEKPKSAAKARETVISRYKPALTASFMMSKHGEDMSFREMWESASQRFETTTNQNFDLNSKVSLDDCLKKIENAQSPVEDRDRRDAPSRRDKWKRHGLSTLRCLRLLGGVVAEGAGMVFQPSNVCFSALSMLLDVPQKVHDFWENVDNLLDTLWPSLSDFQIYQDIKQFDHVERQLKEIDAAVAVAAALNMTEPASTGIGGDMFCLFFDATNKDVHALDGSGRSAMNTSVEQIREQLGVGIEDVGKLPFESALSVTVPGAAAGWVDAVEGFGSGKVGLEEVLMPAIELGEEGFPVSEISAQFVSKRIIIRSS
ncbi:Cytochrome P450 monooxygenase easM [Colletotrichum sp. SAR11_59]|nr:Cytochrome P450 monooxygenase easM [Colletotrichum sp. SAR11_59]